MKPDGGPAFPVSDDRGDSYNFMEPIPLVGGMSLRDYFAAQVLSQACAENNAAMSAGLAYRYADAMIAERAKP